MCFWLSMCVIIIIILSSSRIEEKEKHFLYDHFDFVYLFLNVNIISHLSFLGQYIFKTGINIHI